MSSSSPPSSLRRRSIRPPPSTVMTACYVHDCKVNIMLVLHVRSCLFCITNKFLEITPRSTIHIEYCQYIATSWDTPKIKLVQPRARENIAHDYPAEKPSLNDGEGENIPLLSSAHLLPLSLLNGWKLQLGIRIANKRFAIENMVTMA